MLEILVTLNNMVSPFDYELDELIHIASGLVATPEIQTDLHTANERGETILQVLQTASTS